MAKDYSVPILSGEGDNDYARYMRTDTLLSLQRRPDEVVHRDELLFQTVHQTTELWLKLACFEVAEAANQIRVGALGAAINVLPRAVEAVEYLVQQLDMLRHLAPWTFQTIRTVLGHGSGFESPGFQAMQRVSEDAHDAFMELVGKLDVDLVEVYKGDPQDEMYRLCEALIEWDEAVAVWRVRHYKIATRIIGHRVVGTKGTPVDVLTRLISHKFFPELWEVRTILTETGPMAELDES